MKKQVLAILTAVSLLASPAALAQNVKHERVFGVLDADGTTQTVVDSVWLENADKVDELSDLSGMADPENVKGKETFTKDGETLLWQAKGSDIWYQGTLDTALPVTPVITCKLDGEDVAAADVKGRSGKLETTIAFQSSSSVPHLMLTGMLLSDDQVSGVTVDNGFTFTDGSHILVVGYGVTGVDVDKLPDHVTFICDVTDFDPSDLFTVVTSEPLSKAKDELADTYETLNSSVREASDDLAKLTAGDMVEGDSDMAKLFSGLMTLTDGTAALNTGATQLSDGLATLTANNDTLNGAASTVFDTLLTAATAQLQASLPDLPALTQENWQTVLDGAMTSVSEESIRAQATEQARTQVEAEVKKNESEIRKQVEAAVQGKVLEAVLNAAGMTMTAEDYQAAVKAKQVPEDQQTQVEAAVTAQMATDEVKAQIEAALADTESQLVEQNLASDEVQANLNKQLEGVLAQAQAGYDQLNALKTQLTAYAQFQQGLTDYTAGVVQAQTGAAQLAEGTATLDSGVAELKTKLTDALTPVLNNDVIPALDKYQAAADQLSTPEHYDLVSSDMDNTLVFILRSAW